MKNKTQKLNQSELKNRPEQLNTRSRAKANKTKEFYVDFKQRTFNRTLSQEKVMASLQRWMPYQFAKAKKIGEWIWIKFPSVPVLQIRQEISQLGFHWNRKRQLWQHPCGRLSFEPTQQGLGSKGKGTL